MATGYGMDGPAIQSRSGARVSAPVQTGPGAHPASCTMGTGSFPGVNLPGRDTDPSSTSRAVVKKGAIPLLPLWAVQPVQSLSACTRVHFTFFFIGAQKNSKGALDLLLPPLGRLSLSHKILFPVVTGLTLISFVSVDIF